MFNIQNRRYLGNKFKITDFIAEVIESTIGEFHSFCDLFAGTGVVGSRFNTRKNVIIANDILYSNYVCLKTFITWNKPLDQIIEKIKYLNSVTPSDENYFSINFGDLYFSKENAMKIGFIRELIDNISEDEDEKEVLICSLIYATDKVANTVGHYDAFRKKMDSFHKLKLLAPNVNYKANEQNQVFKENANDLIKIINPDVLYLDPPYNSRQYSDTYHLLENLSVWNKPNVFGIARKMDRKHIKSDYCTSEAGLSFSNLVQEANCKFIMLSYNNTGKNKDGRSNAAISDDEILTTLNQKGDVRVFEKDYRAFTTGKSNGEGNVERIFVCLVR